jgi:hypothetical protein
VQFLLNVKAVKKSFKRQPLHQLLRILCDKLPVVALTLLIVHQVVEKNMMK